MPQSVAYAVGVAAATIAPGAATLGSALLVSALPVPAIQRIELHDDGTTRLTDWNTRPPMPPRFIRRAIDLSILNDLKVPKRPGGIGPLVASGDCLEPWIPDGAQFYVDDNARARDGDIVFVHWGPRISQWLEEQVGTPVPPTAIKVLYSCGPQYWLAQTGGFFALDDTTILGVVCRVVLPGEADYVPDLAARWQGVA